jgi:putative SbcD/Mre11-related phosphoesterase
MNEFNEFKDTEIFHETLLLKDSKSLIVSDIHLGFGRQISAVKFKNIVRLKEVLKQLGPKEIIFNGDLFHEFGSFSWSAFEEFKEMIAFIKEKGIKYFFVKGNHDTILKSYLKKGFIKKLPKEHFIRNKNLICHGDNLPNVDLKNVKRIIIGHLHPAITISENQKQESFKCFLKGQFHGKELIIMPSFSRETIGKNVLGTWNIKEMSPFILAKRYLNNFEVYVLDDKNKVIFFGTINHIKKVLSQSL